MDATLVPLVEQLHDQRVTGCPLGEIVRQFPAFPIPQGSACGGEGVDPLSGWAASPLPGMMFRKQYFSAVGGTWVIAERSAVSTAPESTREVLRRAIALVLERIPYGWAADDPRTTGEASDPTVDAVIDLIAPDGKRTRLIFEAKTVVERRDVPLIAERMRSIVGDNEVPVVAGRYLPPSVREALTEQAISYVDATGNIRITSVSPAIYLADRGENRDPWRGAGRPRGTLKGEPAARVVRALLDYRRRWRVRDLISASGASTGATYRVLDYLQREDLVSKGGDEFIVSDWERLLRAWSADWLLWTANRVGRFLEPRGIEEFEERLTAGSDARFAVTGSLAAQTWTRVAPARAAYVYVPSIEWAADEWGLRPNDTAPNVILLEPKTTADIVFTNTSESLSNLKVAATAQVAADLLNGPGREPAEGEALIEWMKQNEPRWRRE